MALGVVTTIRSMELSNPVKKMRKMFVSGGEKCVRFVAKHLNLTIPTSLPYTATLMDCMVSHIKTNTLEGVEALAKMSCLNKDMRKRITQIKEWQATVESARSRKEVKKQILSQWGHITPCTSLETD